MKKKIFLTGTAVLLSVAFAMGAEASPVENVTKGEVLVAAVRAHAGATGNDTPQSFDYAKNGYADFETYAVTNGIVSSGELGDLSENATKLETAALLARALPDAYYKEINAVYNIPDISSSEDYYADALKMYRAGIMTGEKDKNFYPDDDVSLHEFNSYFMRLIFSDRRLDLEDEKVREEKQAHMLNYTDSMDGPKEGIESGWELDNRAGGFKTSLSGNGTLVDMMTDESSRLIRHFNVINEDKIDATFRLRISSGFNGNKIEFCDADGNPAYRIVCENDALNIENADGTLTKISDKLPSSALYSFRVIIDFETGFSSTELNNVPLGEHPLIGDEIKYFAFVTPKEGKSLLSIVDSYMYSNYALHEDFSRYKEIPQGFETYGNVSINDGSIELSPVGTAYKRFDPVAGNVCFSFNTYMPEGTTGVEYALMADGKAVVSLTVTDGNLYANGTLVKSNVSDKLWHKLRIEADTDTGKALIKANAKVLATVPFKWNAKHFDEIKLYAGGFDTVKVDDLKVYNIVDYNVPKPVIPEGDDDYIIGMNICSLWVNGEHYGWGCVTPHDDIKPVLGYYDEGIPEMADWENKFMAEHGIDFQAFCWYANESGAPMKATRLGTQLDEAYLHSKYGDDVKFCLLWEAANSSLPANSEAFRNYFVPYWIENYFTDPRYMTVDNKLIFSVFGADKLINVFGTGLKDEFDYMRNEVKNLGFDGMIITASNIDINSLSKYGFDAWQAYSWGNNGYQLNENINRNTNAQKNKDVYVIPTVSVGFNSVSWFGIRYPLMTVANYKAANEWVKNTYIPKYALNDNKTWNDKLVWISTWNEYGEGTYIMPSDGLNGFGYLDALRDVYTSGGTHTDVVPSAAQKENFNHLYPQDRRILRAYGNYGIPNVIEERFFDLTISGEFDTYFSKESLQSYTSTSSNGTTLKTLDTGSNDAIIYFRSAALSGYTADDVERIEVVASGIPAGTPMQMFFTTSVSKTLSAANSVTSAVSTGTHEQTFVLNLSENKNFTGKFNILRLDPLYSNGVTFTIKSIRMVPRNKKVFDLTQSGVFSTNFSTESMQNYSSVSSAGTTLKSLAAGQSDDAIIHFKAAALSDLTADDVNRIEVVASGIPEGTAMQLFFTTTTSPTLGQVNSVQSAPSKGTQEQTFILNLAEHLGFSGKFNTLRLDPLQKNDVTFTIKSISFIKNETVDLYVNGRKIDFAIKPEYNAVHDTWFIPFEPGKSLINFMLYVYHEWDYDTKTLKLYRDDKCVEFVNGSDVARIDGKDYKLSAPVYQVDNIPMLPVEDLAEIFGFGCEFKHNAYYYTTPEKYIFDGYIQEEGQWNFDMYGFLGGWQCDSVSADYGDGTVIIYSDNSDPRFRTPTDGNLGIDTSKYSKIEVRCRWENYGGSGMMGFFFTTDSDTSETQSKFTGLIIAPKSDEFVTLTFDMSTNSNWQGILKSLRYDIFDAKGWCEVDYIKLIQ